MTKDLPDPELLRKLLRYEPDTGKLFWLPRNAEMFPSGHRTAQGNCNQWNSRCAGKQAMSCVSNYGYLCGPLLGKTYYAHRVAWAIFYGKAPINEIDHINGDRSDNRIENLRIADREINAKNRKIRSDNVSGCTGVNLHKPSGKWHARINIDKKRKFVGSFDSLEDAIIARSDAQRGHGYTSRHGK